MKRTNGFLIGALFVLAVFLLAAPGGSQRLETMAFGSGVYNLPVMLDVNEAGQLVVTELGTGTPIPTDSPTPTYTPKPTATVTATDTPLPPTLTPTATTTQTASIEPYPEAPPCTDHDNNTFHTIWNEVDGCHYTTEHGTSPFTAAIAAAFPGLDLFELLGGVQIGHTNPSAPTENTLKHGGMKWQADPAAPNGCLVGFEGGTVAIDAYAIQYHEFGPQFIEFETSNHSSAALLRQCKPDDPSDKGYIYTVQLQEYGERCLPYQGLTLPYPDNFQPEWDCAFGQYFTTEGVPLVRPDLAFYNGAVNRNNLSIWTSKIGTSNPANRPPTSLLFRLLFRVRDAYQVIDSNDLFHPFNWFWLCSNDDGLTYDPTGCRYNNSTATVHEIAGDIPAAWDGAGFDTDPRPGRISAVIFVTAFGELAPNCTEAGPGCYPLILVNAFVGRYSSELSAEKVGNPTAIDTPERDVYFCNGLPCNETDAGAVPSGWIGDSN